MVRQGNRLRVSWTSTSTRPPLNPWLASAIGSAQPQVHAPKAGATLSLKSSPYGSGVVGGGALVDHLGGPAAKALPAWCSPSTFCTVIFQIVVGAAEDRLGLDAGRQRCAPSSASPEGGLNMTDLLSLAVALICLARSTASTSRPACSARPDYWRSVSPRWWRSTTIHSPTCRAAGGIVGALLVGFHAGGSRCADGLPQQDRQRDPRRRSTDWGAAGRATTIIQQR